MFLARQRGRPPPRKAYRSLSEDERRNGLFLDDVIGSLDAGRSTIVLKGGVGAKKRRACA